MRSYGALVLFCVNKKRMSRRGLSWFEASLACKMQMTKQVCVFHNLGNFKLLSYSLMAVLGNCKYWVCYELKTA